MRIEQLHYLLELYRTRSFSKAAENVFITQPSLSTAISTLEEELGVKLFERMRSGVYPTAMGEAVVKIAAELIDCENRIYQTVHQSKNPPDRLRLMTIPAVSFGVLLEVMAQFQKNYPHVNLTLNEFPPSIIVHEAVHPLNNEPGTFAICALNPRTKDAIIEHLKEDHIEATHVFTDQFVCYIAGDHPFAQQPSIRVSEFLSLPGIDLNLLTKEAPVSAYTRLHRMGTDEMYERLKSNTHIEVDTLSNLKRLVSAGSGVALMPSFIIYKDRDYLAGNIVALPFSDINLPIEYYLLKSNLYPLKPMEKDFLEGIIQHFTHTDSPINIASDRPTAQPQ